MTAPSEIDLSLAPLSIFSLHPFDTVTARLSGGSLGEATLLIKNPTPTEGGLPRLLYPDVPYLNRGGEYAFFGATFANGGDAMTVTDLDFEIPGGYDVWANHGQGAELFAREHRLVDEQDGLDASGHTVDGWSWIDAKHVRWHGARTVPALSGAWWGVMWRIASDVSGAHDQATSVEPASRPATHSSLTFPNGYAEDSYAWSASPGIFLHRVPPDSASGSAAANGYPTSPGTHTQTARVTSVLSHVANDSSYPVDAASSGLLQTQNAISNSTFQVERRAVPIGTTLRADANLESLTTTLAGQGAADSTIRVDLYAPFDPSCEAVASWSRDARSMPGARPTVMLDADHDGTGLTPLFVGASDHRVYDIATATGQPTWSADVGSDPTALEYATLGPLTQRLFVGTSGGRVVALDAANGAVVWDVALSAPTAVTDLSVDVARGSVFAAGGGAGATILDVTDGSSIVVPLASEDVSTNSTLSLGDGTFLVVSPAATRRIDVSGAIQGTDVGGRGVALGSGGIVMARESTVDLLRASDLVAISSVGLPSPIALAVAGDATGDDHDDLTVMLSDGSVAAIDGADGAIAWSRPPPPALPSDPKLPTARPFSGFVKSDDASCLPRQEAVQQAASRAGKYGDDPICAPSSDLGVQPLTIAAGHGRVTATTSRGGTPTLWTIDTGGTLLWSRTYDPQTRPLAGAFTTVPQRDLLAIGLLNGNVQLVDAATGDGLSSTSPAAFAGKFSFYLTAPAGGFYGSHLLVLTLSWSDGAATHEARFMDWFEVVDERGEPVLEPSYRIEIVTADRSAPIGAMTPPH